MAEIPLEEARKRLLGKGKKKKSRAPTQSSLPKPPYILNRLDLWVPGLLTKTLNTWSRMAVREKAKLKEPWEQAIGPALKALAYRHIEGTKWRLTMTRLTSHHTLMDEDGLYGSMKALIDVVRDSGLIPDDSPEYLTIRAYQEKVFKDSKGTHITIERIQGPWE